MVTMMMTMTTIDLVGWRCNRCSQ